MNQTVFVVLWETYGTDAGKIAAFSTAAAAERCADRWKEERNCDGAQVVPVILDDDGEAA